MIRSAEPCWNVVLTPNRVKEPKTNEVQKKVRFVRQNPQELRKPPQPPKEKSPAVKGQNQRRKQAGRPPGRQQTMQTALLPDQHNDAWVSENVEDKEEEEEDGMCHGETGTALRRERLGRKVKDRNAKGRKDD